MGEEKNYLVESQRDSLTGEMTYTTDYYTRHAQRSMSSAQAVLGRTLKVFKPRSMLDVGCGSGAWLRAGGDLGIEKLQGIDGDYVTAESLLISQSLFKAADLRKPFKFDKRFDLTVCVEVAEHLPHERGPTLVRDLAQTSDVIVFSGAAPFQGGEQHMNEQWPEYWAILFRRHGYVCFDVFREQFWASSSVESWYAQNVFLFVKSGHKIESKLKQFRADNIALSRVHPEIFLINIARYRPNASAQIAVECSDWRRLVDAYVSGRTKTPPLAAVACTRMTYEDDFEWRRLKMALDEQLSLKKEWFEPELARLSAELDRVNGVLHEQLSLKKEWFEPELARLGAEIERLNVILDERLAEINRLNRRLAVQGEHIDELGKLIVHRDHRILALARSEDAMKLESRQLRLDYEVVQGHLNHMRQAIFLNSPVGWALRTVFRIILTGLQVVDLVLGPLSPRLRTTCRHLQELIVARRNRAFVDTVKTLIRSRIFKLAPKI